MVLFASHYIRVIYYRSVGMLYPFVILMEDFMSFSN